LSYSLKQQESNCTVVSSGGRSKKQHVHRAKRKKISCRRQPPVSALEIGTEASSVIHPGLHGDKQKNARNVRAIEKEANHATVKGKRETTSRHLGLAT